MPPATLDPVIERLKECRRPVRIVTMGSSNTERTGNIGNAQNWVDWLDTGLRWWYGRSHITINVGISGEPGTQSLARFEEDVAKFDPFLVFITCGGNDANPDHRITAAGFRAALTAMVDRVLRLPEGHVILQTYYAFDDAPMAAMGREEWLARFPAFMQVIRDVARDRNVYLIDHLVRWERLKRRDYPLFKQCMFDPQHLNVLGNMVFGLDVLRLLGVQPLNQWKEVCAEGMRVQAVLDGLK